MTTEPTTEDVAQTLARYEALAISTGEWEGADPPQFSADGVDWFDFWLDETTRPALARAVVYRRGVRPVTVVIPWAEHVPEQRPVAPGEIDWHAKWMQNPMSLFGSAALRRAYQRAFRDVIRDPREASAKPQPPAEREWATDLAATTTPAEVDALARAAYDAGVMTPETETHFRNRRNELSPPSAPKRDAWKPRTESRPALAAQTAAMPSPRPPAPGVHTLADVVKPGSSSRKSRSRGERDSGKRHGGRS